MEIPGYFEDTRQSVHHPTEAAWVLLESMDSNLREVADRMAVIDARLQQLESAGLLSAAQRDEKQSLSEDMEKLFTESVTKRASLESLIAGIERVETGEITEDHLALLIDTLCPTPPDEDEPIRQLSKRKLAIRETNLKEAARLGIKEDSWEFRYTFGKNGTRVTSDDPELRTDPRRISSGRGSSKLIAKSALDTFDAEGSFMDATADTHGGKTRKLGKNGTSYVGKSGRKIRKR